MPKNKSLLDDVQVPEPPQEVVDALESESGGNSAMDEHPKKKAASRKAARKAHKQPKTQALSAVEPEDGSKYASSPKNSVGRHCSVCGKPLSKPKSINQGMGDVCAGRHKLLPTGVTMEVHRENNTVDELPGGYMKLKDAIAEVRRTQKNHGITGHRLLKAVGGNGFLQGPLNEHFKGVFYKGTRYIPASCLNYLKELKKA